MSEAEALARLSIGIDGPLAEAGSPGGYVGRIVDVTPGRAPEERDQRDIVIPLGEGQSRTLEIKPGEYIVEAVSPSGELLDRRVSVEGGDVPAEVRLGRKGRLSGELGWQVVAGNINRVRAAAESAADKGVREARRSMARARWFWRRLGWARIVLIVVALALAAAAAGLFSISGPSTSSDANQAAPASENASADEMPADEMSAAPEAAPAPAENAVEATPEATAQNMTAAPAPEATAQNVIAAPAPEASAQNMTAEIETYRAPLPARRFRRRTLERTAGPVEANVMASAESAEANLAASAEPAEANMAASAEPLPPRPESEGAPTDNAAAPAPAPAASAPDAEAEAQAPQPEPATPGDGLSVLWPAILTGIALLTFGLIFTRWTQPREALAAADTEGPETVAADAAVAAPGGLAPTLFRAGGGAGAWAVVDAAEQGLSAVKALLEPVAAKAALPARVCEGFRMHDIAPGQLVAGSEADGPLFAFVPAAGFAGELIAVPMPWALTDGSQAGFEIAASTSQASSFSAASTIKDAAMTAILGYMAAGRLRQAEILVRDAKDLLNFKYTNPMAAALGAYVLLASCGEPGTGANWRPWIGNLYADFDWLPDGAILQGWNLLQQQASPDDIDRARACFLDAVDRGVPIFSEGVRMLQSGLAFFGGEGAEDRVKQAIKRADQLAMRCAPAQAFTTIRVSADP